MEKAIVLLSGGLDSSIITAVVARELQNRGEVLQTFSVDYLKEGFRGIRDFRKLVELAERGERHE